MARKTETPKQGHLALKSSVLAPTSTSYFGQHMVLNHLNSHYRRISSAKAAVDTSAPRSMKKHIRVQDQKKRQHLDTSQDSIVSGRRSKSASLESLSRDINMSHISRPQSSQYFNDSIRQSFDHSTPAPTTRHYTADGDDDYQQLSQRQNSTLPKPLVSRSRWKKLQLNEASRNDISEHLHDSNGSNGVNMETSNTEDFTSPRNGFQSARSSRLSNNYPGLDCSTSSSAYARRKKDLQNKMWMEEQKYMEFISEVTTDVLARGLFTNRVLNKVFESHIEKRREELDETRMRDMIEQLKVDLNVSES